VTGGVPPESHCFAITVARRPVSRYFWGSGKLRALILELMVLVSRVGAVLEPAANCEKHLNFFHRTPYFGPILQKKNFFSTDEAQSIGNGLRSMWEESLDGTFGLWLACSYQGYEP
jgi:hypothetical protein